ncbi:MAG: OmpA family protein [Bacteroidota bacterium]|nr:OmpA family protein [Bacteroidota bacterium]
MKIQKSGYLLLLMLVFVSCVPLNKYKKLNDANQKCEQERDLLKNDNEKFTVSNTELLSKNDLLNKELKQLVNDSIEKTKTLERLQKENSELNEMNKNMQESLKGTARDKSKLFNELQKTQAGLQEKEKNLEEKEKSLNDLKVELDKQNASLKSLQSILSRKDSVVKSLKDKVSNALLGFENNGLSVNIKNGKVYVSLEEQLLFRTGSTAVDSRGVSALKKLSKVLEQNEDINIMIEGHTDDVHYKSPTASIQDNWDLSVKRATAIVRILLDGSKIDPKRLTAAGRGEFVPIDPAKTPLARQKNRRTEIILTPKLDELFKVLENN